MFDEKETVHSFDFQMCVHTSIATLTEGCTSSIILLERALFASIAELLRESFKSVSMVPVAMATGDAAIVACSRCGGEGGAVKEFSEDCPHNKNLETRETERVLELINVMSMILEYLHVYVVV